MLLCALGTIRIKGSSISMVTYPFIGLKKDMTSHWDHNKSMTNLPRVTDIRLQVQDRIRHLVSNKGLIAGYCGWDPQENNNYVCGCSRCMLSGHHPHVSISLQTLQRNLLGLVDLNSF